MSEPGKDLSPSAPPRVGWPIASLARTAGRESVAQIERILERQLPRQGVSPEQAARAQKQEETLQFVEEALEPLTRTIAEFTTATLNDELRYQHWVRLSARLDHALALARHLAPPRVVESPPQDPSTGLGAAGELGD